nr:wall-associated receptor kinase 2-like protein [Tanacetum cinerariifolium]
MSRDVITVGSTMRIPLLYRGEYSQWCERFMNYLKEQIDGEEMINSIQNGDQPLPVIAQLSLAGNAQNAPPTLKDPKFWTAKEKKTQKIDRLARSLLIQGFPNDIYSLIDSNETAKYLWDALERQMRGSEYGEQDRKAAILYEYETFKAIEGEKLLDTYLRYLQVINDLKKCGYKRDNLQWGLNDNVCVISSLITLHKPKVLCKADYYANQLSLLKDLADIERVGFVVTVAGDSRCKLESAYRSLYGFKDKREVIERLNIGGGTHEDFLQLLQKTSNTIKQDRMNGMNFTRWKEKIKFLLTAFKVYYVLEGPPVGVMTEEEQRKREQDETLYRGYILKKYTTKKEGADKFITFKFFEFSMEDNVSILDQVHKFLILVFKFKNLNIEIPEKLLVGVIIIKLPSSWHNYIKKLMHTSEDFTLDQIQKYLRIEEETRIREKNLNGASSSKVNYVDSGKNNKGNNKKRKGTWNSSKENKKDKKTIELHMANVTTTDDLWYDSGATTYVCNNRDLFKTYKETKYGHEVMMGDNHTSKVIGSGNVEI